MVEVGGAPAVVRFAAAIAVATLLAASSAAFGQDARPVDTLQADIVAASCSVPPALSRLAMPLEAAQAAIAGRADFKIVALGSSSTQGAGASSPKMCYPAQLESELNRRFNPVKRFEVVNLGKGGEMAADMLSRIDREVLPLKPGLVIWQTGVNDAIAGIGLDDFRMELSQGIDAIRAVGADVMLLDLQYYPRSERVRGYRDYLQVIWQVGQEKGVSVLKRHTYMKHLLDGRKYTAAQILAPDLFHLNDLSYRCLGHMVADAIDHGLGEAGSKHRLPGKAVAAR